jgi:hypothetical protein
LGKPGLGNAKLGNVVPPPKGDVVTAELAAPEPPPKGDIVAGLTSEPPPKRGELEAAKPPPPKGVLDAAEPPPKRVLDAAEPPPKIPPPERGVAAALETLGLAALAGILYFLRSSSVQPPPKGLDSWRALAARSTASENVDTLLSAATASARSSDCAVSAAAVASRAVDGVVAVSSKQRLRGNIFPTEMFAIPDVTLAVDMVATPEPCSPVALGGRAASMSLFDMFASPGRLLASAVASLHDLGMVGRAPESSGCGKGTAAGACPTRSALHWSSPGGGG